MTFIRAIRQHRLRWLLLSVLASVAGLLLSQLAAANAAVSAITQSASGSKPTIVLVHGAWADSGSWDGVVARLQGDGYTVDVPLNPLRGLPDDAAYLAAFLRTSAARSSWSATPTAAP